MTTTLQTSDGTFDLDVLGAKGPVLVQFWAQWCGPCRALGPIIDSIADKYAGTSTLFKVKVDENPVTTGRYGISSIPALKIFSDGEVVWEMVDAAPKRVLEAQFLNEVLP